MKYKIEVTETLQRIITVEADSLSNALIQVGQEYSKGEIVLDSADFVGYEINVIKED